MNNPNASVSRRTVCGALVLTLAPTFTIGNSQAEEAKVMPNQIAEIVTFKLTAGTSDNDFAKALEAATAFMRGRKGFVSRRLSIGKDGTYTDHVVWDTLADAEAAMEASMKEVSLGTFIQSIDPQTMKLDHQEIVNSVN
jgi:hypothetical protein